MKKTVRVTCTKDIEIEIADHLLTEESLKEFSENMYPVKSSKKLFEHAGFECFGESNFVEGIGTAANVVSLKDADVLYDVLYEAAGVEILEV